MVDLDKQENNEKVLQIANVERSTTRGGLLNQQIAARTTQECETEDDEADLREAEQNSNYVYIIALQNNYWRLLDTYLDSLGQLPLYRYLSNSPLPKSTHRFGREQGHTPNQASLQKDTIHYV